MLKSDQETVLRALEDARRIVGKCIAGQRDATRAVERLLAVLDEIEVVDALDRMNPTQNPSAGRFDSVKNRPA
jgi:hypothetical protein